MLGQAESRLLFGLLSQDDEARRQLGLAAAQGDSEAQFRLGGCHLNRDSVDQIRDAGFARVQELACGRDRWTLFPQYRGEAIKDRV